MSRIHYIKVTEAARILSCSADAVRKWCDTGKLEFRKTPGGHRMITLDSVNKLAGEDGSGNSTQK